MTGIDTVLDAMGEFLKESGYDVRTTDLGMVTGNDQLAHIPACLIYRGKVTYFIIDAIAVLFQVTNFDLQRPTGDGSGTYIATTFPEHDYKHSNFRHVCTTLGIVDPTEPDALQKLLEMISKAPTPVNQRGR